MFLDQLSVLIAIGFSSASLGITLFMMWLIGRSDTHLLCGAVGLAFIVAGVVLFSRVVESYDANLLFASFVLLIVGFGLVYAGAAKFCSGHPDWSGTVSTVTLGLLLTAGGFVSGYSGIGTIAGNVAIGILMALAGHRYWTARVEFPLLMMANAVLFFLTAASFIACGFALAEQNEFILTARPANWAEDLNSIAAIIGLTGIGTLTLTLNQTRIANRHKSDAMTDALTGLRNRRALLDDRSRIAAPDTAVIVMDLDHFKRINDIFGHDSGDRLLQAFADLILANIGADDLAARIGGEEFCIILPDSGPRTAAAVADRIRSQMEIAAVSTPLGPVRTTVSAGIAVRTGEPETLHALLNRADAALYEAKASGRNRIQISDFSLAA